MPKPPPVVEVGSTRPRETFLIHDDDDDDRSGGHGRLRESRSVVGMGGQGGRRAAADRFGGSERGREGSSSGGHAAAWSPLPRRNQLAPSSPAAARAGAGAWEPEVIELDDDDDEGYEVPSERSEKAAAPVVVKTEPLEYSGSDSDGPPARGRKRAAASAPGGSRKAKKRGRESPVRRSKPHMAGGRGEPGSSGKQRNRKGRGAIGRHRFPCSKDQSIGSTGKKVKSAGRRRHGHRGRHDGEERRAEETRPQGRRLGLAWFCAGEACRRSCLVKDSFTERRPGKGGPAAKYPAPLVSDHSGDGDEMEEVSSDDNRRPRDNEDEEDVVKGKNKVDDNGDSDEMEEVGSDDNRRPRDNEEEEEDVVKGKNKVDDNGDSDEMEEVSSDDNRRPRDNEEEGDVVKGKNKVDDNADSEEMYKSIEEEEMGEDGNGIQDESYAGVDEEDTTEPEEEEERGEEEEEEEESNEAGEEVRGTPSSNANAGGNARPGGDGTPPVRKKNFEGLYLIEKADTSSTGEGMRKRTRSQRRCSDKKLLTRGTFSKPYCIEVSESEPEPEEEVPPPAQAQPSDWAFEDDSGGDDGGAPAKKRRRQQQFFDSDGSGSEDSSDDSESDRTFARNARKGPSSSRPTNGGGGAPYRQQQTAKEGRRDYAGCSNPGRVKSYAANANAGNPADRGNLQQQGDVSFKNNALLPQKGKREKKAYDDLFKSIFDEIEKHPNGSAPAQAHQGWDNRHPLVFSFGDEEEEVKEKSEHEMYMEDLWGELDFCLETVYADKKNNIYKRNSLHCGFQDEGSNVQEIPANKQHLCKEGKEHDFFQDDQIGILCRCCSFVQTEIRHVLPLVGNWSEERDPREDRELDRELEMHIKKYNDMLASNGYEGECISIGSSSHKSGPVWDLIPGARENMFPHQREGFEFMWTKLAGGTDIEQVKKPRTDLSGCVVSHAPGTGKTRLAITFVQSYLELFPRCCPVILAPKGMLATWEQEFKKWNSKVQFHVLNSPRIQRNGGDKTIERLAADDEDLTRKLLGRKFSRNLKLLSWSEGNSVIGLSYTMFTNLTKEGGSGKMRKLFLERPDLLVLDEGHIPRNKDSLIYKALDQVRTRKRIVLSGTPFQNNFDELHNIFSLLRAGDVDPSFWNSLTVNNVTDERLNEIRTKLERFVHIHNGDILNKSLPGLRESVVILNPLPMQKKIIEMIEKGETKSAFGLEHKISLASVHPSLLTSMSNLPDEVASIVDEPSLERIRLKPSEGVKARFVYEIVHRCRRSKERVLVFSQYLEPLNLIMEQLSREFNWTRDKDIILMTGDVRIETRQSLMMAFNDMNSDSKVMLASTKACGEGIQLIGASRVVLLDVVWNPSVGRQAIGRAYRIGQQKIVHTYNLITEGTQEKSKYDRQAKKDHMSKLLFSNELQPAQCNQSPESIFNDSILEDMTEDENLKEMFVNILPSQ
ncbi:hypothetical protein ACQ4PT_018433 [Festuca glaucescens]